MKTMIVWKIYRTSLETVIKGNFAMPNDVDAFYFVAKANGIQGVSIQPQAVNSVEKAKYPAELFGNYYGFVTILEDMNKNRKVDEEEYDTARHIFKFHASGLTTGSFQTEKGKSYIVIASAFFENLVTIVFDSIRTKDGASAIQVMKTKALLSKIIFLLNH